MVIGSKDFALSMKGDRETETFIFLISTPDTGTMPEAPEEVTRAGKSQGNHRLVINALSKRETNPDSWQSLYFLCMCEFEIYSPQLGYISVNWLSGTRSQTHLQFIKEVTSKLRWKPVFLIPNLMQLSRMLQGMRALGFKMKWEAINLSGNQFFHLESRDCNKYFIHFCKGQQKGLYKSSL